MAIDPNYIPAFTIEEVILDKDTGAPLSGGIVTFEQANQPGVLKPVYQITYTSGIYNYIQLPNPMTLSSIGTFVDALDNPIVPYFFPYDSHFDPEYYRVIVESSGLVPQFVRDPVPYIPDSGETSISSAFENEISNPQFSEVLFDTTMTDYVYNFNAANFEEVPLAPDWDLVVSSAAAATVTVSQIRPVGTLNILTNPGTILKINSTGVSRLRLRQRFYGSPNIWGNSFLSGSFVAKTFEGTASTINMYYSQSDGSVVDQLISSGILNGSGSYEAHPGSVAIPPSFNTENFPDAYVDIEFALPLSTEIAITSIMLAFTGSVSVESIIYDEESQSRQIDHLFHYYKPQLEYKPIPSHLTAWNFPLNPAQFGESIAATAGANSSKYVWDQTILFQTTTLGIDIARNNLTYGLQCIRGADSSFAIIQYLEDAQARQILSSPFSIQLQGLTDSSTIDGTVSCYWTDDVTLPDIKSGTEESLVSSITDGIPATTNGNWTIVEREALGNTPPFTFTNVVSETSFSHFDASVTAAPTTATFFAIVITFDTLLAAIGNLTINYCSLVSGDIATRPAPQTPDEVLRECQYYYTKSFPPSIAPANNLNASYAAFGLQNSNANLSGDGPYVRFPSPMRVAPTVDTVILYNPAANNSEIRNLSFAGDYISSVANSFSVYGFLTTGTTNSGSSTLDLIAVNWSADARLGVI